MDILDDDSLCLIFEYLSLPQQLALTKVCQRFHQLITDIVWNTRYRQIHTHRPKSTTSTMNSISKIQYAHDQVASLNKENYQDFYALNAHNIEKLYLGNISREAFSTYLGRHIQRPELTFYFTFKYIRLIELNCTDSALHDGHIRMITENCPTLENLMLRSPYVTGKHLRSLKSMRNLNVSHCNIQAMYLEEILNELHHLMSLNISDNRDLGYSSVIKWGSIRELYISEMEFLHQFSDGTEIRHCLDRLKKLNIIFCKVLDITSAEWELLNFRDVWINFLKALGFRTKILKISHISMIIKMAFNRLYNIENIITFPNLIELHVEEQEHGVWMRSLLTCTNLESLYLYDITFFNEILEFIKKNAVLEFIYIRNSKESERNGNILKFIKDLHDWLETQSDRSNVIINLEIFSDDPLYDLQELKAVIESDEFQNGSTLDIQVTKKLEKNIWKNGYLELEMYD